MGGIEKYLINIYRNIDKEKFEIKFLAFKGSKPCFYEEIKNDLIYITHRNKNYIKFLKDLKDVYIKNNFDIIHYNLMDFSCFERIIIAKKYTKSKLILHSHIADSKIISKKTAFLSKIGELILKKEDIYYKTACSKTAGQDMFKNFKKNNFEIFNNGIEVKNHLYNKESRKIIRKNIGINDDEILIGNVGRFVYQKNHEKLIDIFIKINEINNKTKLLCIGKGPEKEKIIKRLKQKNLLRQVIFLEDISNINDYMSAMDVFLFPSRFEGLGIVLLESQASGLKSVITDTLPQEVELTPNIIRISLNEDSEKWAKVTLENISKKRLIEESCLETFNIENTVKKVEEFYKAVMNDVENKK